MSAILDLLYIRQSDTAAFVEIMQSFILIQNSEKGKELNKRDWIKVE